MGCLSASSVGRTRAAWQPSHEETKTPRCEGKWGAKLPPSREETLPGQSGAWLRAGGAPRTPSLGQAALSLSRNLVTVCSPPKPAGKPVTPRGQRRPLPPAPRTHLLPQGAPRTPAALPPWPGPLTPNFLAERRVPFLPVPSDSPSALSIRGRAPAAGGDWLSGVRRAWPSLWTRRGRAEGRSSIPPLVPGGAEAVAAAPSPGGVRPPPARPGTTACPVCAAAARSGGHGSGSRPARRSRLNMHAQ